MAEESYSFSTARTRLEEIVTQVRKKDTSLEKSLDLLEEGVRLANACTELIDHADWAAAEAAPGASDPDGAAAVVDVEEQVSAAHYVADAEVDDGHDDSWADDAPPADEHAAADDPSADER
jgi:exodeoxyribonuclease VII small subunit